MGLCFLQVVWEAKLPQVEVPCFHSFGFMVQPVPNPRVLIIRLHSCLCRLDTCLSSSPQACDPQAERQVVTAAAAMYCLHKGFLSCTTFG